VRFDLFVQKTSNLFAERRLLRLIVLLIGGLQVFNCLLLFSVLDQKRTILIPVGNPAKVSVSGSSADTSYLREMGRYIAGLGLSYNPGTVRQQYEELLSLFDPERFASAKEQLYEAADTVETAGASSVFFIAEMTDHPEQKILDISGTRQLFVQDKKTDEKHLVYRLSYQIRDGRFWIVDFSERND
jgi:conjugal transfer pilus assembly protein TraE